MGMIPQRWRCQIAGKWRILESLHDWEVKSYSTTIPREEHDMCKWCMKQRVRYEGGKWKYR